MSEWEEDPAAPAEPEVDADGKKLYGRIGDSPEIKAAWEDITAHVPTLMRNLNLYSYEWQQERKALLEAVCDWMTDVMFRTIAAANAFQTLSATTMGSEVTDPMVNIQLYEYGYVIQAGEIKHAENIKKSFWEDGLFRYVTSLFYKEEFQLELFRQAYKKQEVLKEGQSSYQRTHTTSGKSLLLDRDLGASFGVSDDPIAVTTTRTGTEYYTAEGNIITWDSQLDIDVYESIGLSAMEAADGSTSYAIAGNTLFGNLTRGLLSFGFASSASSHFDDFGRYTGARKYDSKTVGYTYVGLPVPMFAASSGAPSPSAEWIKPYKTEWDPKPCEEGESPGPCFGIFTEHEINYMTAKADVTDPNEYNRIFDLVATKNHGHLHSTFTGAKPNTDPLYYQLTMNYTWSDFGRTLNSSDWKDMWEDDRIPDTLGGGYGLGARASAGGKVSADDIDRLSLEEMQGDLIKWAAHEAEDEAALKEAGTSTWQVRKKDVGYGYNGTKAIDSYIYSTVDYGVRWGTTDAHGAHISYKAGGGAAVMSKELPGISAQELGAARLFAEESSRGWMLRWAGPSTTSRRDTALATYFETIQKNSAMEDPDSLKDFWTDSNWTGTINDHHKCMAGSTGDVEGVRFNVFHGEDVNGSPNIDDDSANKCRNETSMLDCWENHMRDWINDQRAANKQVKAWLCTSGDPDHDWVLPKSMLWGGGEQWKLKDMEPFGYDEGSGGIEKGTPAAVQWETWWSAKRSANESLISRVEYDEALRVRHADNKFWPRWMKIVAETHKEGIVAPATKLIELIESMIEASDEIRKYYRKLDTLIEEVMADIEMPDKYWDRQKYALGLFQSELLGERYVNPSAEHGKKQQEAHNIASQEAKPSEISDIDWAKRLIYKEQCFLLSFINDISLAKKDGFENPKGAAEQTKGAWGTATAKRMPYYVRKHGRPNDKIKTNACIQVRGNPYSFINLLTQHPSQAMFFEMSTDKISHLQPMIRLHKIEYDIDKSGHQVEGSEREIPIGFDSYSKNLAKVLQTTKRRGNGVGIQSFTFTYDGSNPFAAKKSIKANLKVFANSFDELLEERAYGLSKYRYVDLALKTRSKPMKAKKCVRGIHEENDELSKLNFRLKAVVGWAAPPGKDFLEGPFTGQAWSKAEKYAVDNSYVTLELTPTVHNFEFDEQGRVVMNINYLAYVEDFFDQTPFNIFTDTDITKKQYARKFHYSALSHKCSGEELGNIKESYADMILEEKKDGVSSLVRDLLATDRVRYINLPYDEVKQFIQKGPWYAYEAYPDGISGLVMDSVTNLSWLQKNIDGALDHLDKKAGGQVGIGGTDDEGSVAASLAVSNPDNENLVFFFLSDLVDVVLAGIDKSIREMPKIISEIDPTRDPIMMESNFDSDDKKFIKCQIENETNKLKGYIKQFEKLRILLGPLEITHPTNPEKNNFICLGDLPISIKYFIEWLTDNLAKKEETVMPIAAFCNGIINNLVRNFMNDDSCFQVSVKQKIRLNQSTITSYPVVSRGSKDVLDEFTQYMKKYLDKPDYAGSSVHRSGLSPRPFLNIAGPPKRQSGTVDESINYLTYFAGRTQPIEKQKGNKTEDLEYGIFHYLIGKPRGIVKTIDLSKTDSKGLAEVRFEQDGYDGLRQLRVVYDAKIKTYASVQTFPGSYLFIDPRGFAPNMISYGKGDNDLSQYGIGGYYMIIRSTHNFGPGVAETLIDAKWVAQLETESDAEEQEKRKEEAGSNDMSLCPTHRSKRKEAETPPTPEAVEPPGAWDMVTMAWDEFMS